MLRHIYINVKTYCLRKKNMQATFFCFIIGYYNKSMYLNLHKKYSLGLQIKSITKSILLIYVFILKISLHDNKKVKAVLLY